MLLCVPDECIYFTIINGTAGVFDLEEYGLTISYKSDCLPSSINECKLSISANLTTDIPLPSGSVLVSGVYHITTMPFIDQLNQPVEICMEHCANDFNQLCFVVAKDQNQQNFEYMEGGRFEIDAKTGRRIGRICVSSFSGWAQVLCGWFTGQDDSNEPNNSNEPNEAETANKPITNEPKVENHLAYCGRLYYQNTELHQRKIWFVITKNLSFAAHVSDHPAHSLIPDKLFC